MKTKILAYTLIQGLGITIKKTIYLLNTYKDIKSITNIKKEKVSSSLTNLAEIILEKEKNIVRIKIYTNYINIINNF